MKQVKQGFQLITYILNNYKKRVKQNETRKNTFKSFSCLLRCLKFITSED